MIVAVCLGLGMVREFRAQGFRSIQIEVHGTGLGF